MSSLFQATRADAKLPTVFARHRGQIWIACITLSVVNAFDVDYRKMQVSIY